MSLWPIVCIVCLECGKSMSVFDHGLDTYDYQQEFFDALTREGWDVPGRARDVEADDDGVVLGCCPECKEATP